MSRTRVHRYTTLPPQIGAPSWVRKRRSERVWKKRREKAGLEVQVSLGKGRGNKPKSKKPYKEMQGNEKKTRRKGNASKRTARGSCAAHIGTNISSHEQKQQMKRGMKEDCEGNTEESKVGEEREQADTTYPVNPPTVCTLVVGFLWSELRSRGCRGGGRRGTSARSVRRAGEGLSGRRALGDSEADALAVAHDQKRAKRRAHPHEFPQLGEAAKASEDESEDSKAKGVSGFVERFTEVERFTLAAEWETEERQWRAERPIPEPRVRLGCCVTWTSARWPLRTFRIEGVANKRKDGQGRDRERRHPSSENEPRASSKIDEGANVKKRSHAQRTRLARMERKERPRVPDGGNAKIGTAPGSGVELAASRPVNTQVYKVISIGGMPSKDPAWREPRGMSMTGSMKVTIMGLHGFNSTSTCTGGIRRHLTIRQNFVNVVSTFLGRLMRRRCRYDLHF
ncbi:hypothetical protein K438DRAFT_1942436 [Mycena galopus ATCC 62051]|nr:hypothetical protein K438DRAFT_1942436 [Mycena galopus ATCC 62051]